MSRAYTQAERTAIAAAFPQDDFSELLFRDLERLSRGTLHSLETGPSIHPDRLLEFSRAASTFLADHAPLMRSLATPVNWREASGTDTDDVEHAIKVLEFLALRAERQGLPRQYNDKNTADVLMRGGPVAFSARQVKLEREADDFRKNYFSIHVDVFIRGLLDCWSRYTEQNPSAYYAKSKDAYTGQFFEFCSASSTICRDRFPERFDDRTIGHRAEKLLRSLRKDSQPDG